MPVHDWTRVNAGTFHDFHTSWITHLKESLNDGLLPAGYYAMSEQHAGKMITDVLTLQTEETGPFSPSESGPLAVAEAPPRVRRKVVPSPTASYRLLRRTVAVRHVSNHRLIALVEIISPANKDREKSVNDFVNKAHAALQCGCHLLIVDLFPPGTFDPHGIHGKIWEDFDPADDFPPPDKPLSLAAYEAALMPEAYLEAVSVGDSLPAMPLFLESGRYINTPLEATYQAAYCGMPKYWRKMLE